MRRILRSFAVGLLVGGLVGLWCGMNIGKEQPLLSNPFADATPAPRVHGPTEASTQRLADGTAWRAQ